MEMENCCHAWRPHVSQLPGMEAACQPAARHGGRMSASCQAWRPHVSQLPGRPHVSQLPGMEAACQPADTAWRLHDIQPTKLGGHRRQNGENGSIIKLPNMEAAGLPGLFLNSKHTVLTMDDKSSFSVVVLKLSWFREYLVGSGRKYMYDVYNYIYSLVYVTRCKTSLSYMAHINIPDLKSKFQLKEKIQFFTGKKPVSNRTKKSRFLNTV